MGWEGYPLLRGQSPIGLPLIEIVSRDESSGSCHH